MSELKIVLNALRQSFDSAYVAQDNAATLPSLGKEDRHRARVLADTALMLSDACKMALGALDEEDEEPSFSTKNAPPHVTISLDVAMEMLNENLIDATTDIPDDFNPDSTNLLDHATLADINDLLEAASDDISEEHDVIGSYYQWREEIIEAAIGSVGGEPIITLSSLAIALTHVMNTTFRPLEGKPQNTARELIERVIQTTFERAVTRNVLHFAKMWISPDIGLDGKLHGDAPAGKLYAFKFALEETCGMPPEITLDPDETVTAFVDRYIKLLQENGMTEVEEP